MWIAVAVIVWLWGLALYLVAYYVAVWNWSSLELHAFLGQDFYNSHIPLGGWRATIDPTIVFALVLAAAASMRNWLARFGAALTRHTPLPPRAASVASHLALLALAVPIAQLGVTKVHASFSTAVARAQRADAMEQLKEAAAIARARDPIATGQGFGTLATSYSSGWGLGSEDIVFDFQGRYRRRSTGCSAGSLTEGRYENQEGVLLLHAPIGEVPPDPYPQTYPIELHDVRWGGRRYLLRDAQLLSFCQAVNEGTETREMASGRFLLRSEDRELRATGLPSLPPQWSDFLLSAPLEGRTTEQAADHGAWVNLGSDDGLRPGLHLFIEGVPILPEFKHLWGGRDAIPRAFELVEVEPHRSRLADVQQRQAESMMQPVPIGSVVTSLRPGGA